MRVEGSLVICESCDSRFNRPSAKTLSGTPFTDVSENSVYAAAIRWVFQKNLMNGTSGTTFAPDLTLDKAMLATLLHRLAGKPAVNFRPVFSDVGADLWYSLGVIWASDNNIVAAEGGTMFAPTHRLSKEELATSLQHFARFCGQNSGTDMESAMAWAVQNSLLSGGGAPSDPATRGDAAMFLHYFTQ